MGVFQPSPVTSVNGMTGDVVIAPIGGRTITGTANQITVTNGDGVSGNPTLALPQNIHTGATPTFAGATLNGSATVTGTAATNIVTFKTSAGGITQYINSSGSFVSNNIFPATDSTYSLGLSGNYYANIYTDKLFLNSTATLDGSTAGEIKGTGIFTADNIKRGTGFPEGVVTANVGTVYIDTAVTNGASSWIKKSGTGNTGWQVLGGDTGSRNITSLAVGTPVFSGGVWVRRVGNIVTVSISDFESTWSAAGWLEIIAAATMVGFKPSTPGGENYNTLLGSTFARMQVLTTGVLRVYSGSTGTLRMHNTASYICSSTWPSTLPGTAA